MDTSASVQEHRGEGDARMSDSDDDDGSVDDTSEIHFVPNDKTACTLPSLCMHLYTMLVISDNL